MNEAGQPEPVRRNQPELRRIAHVRQRRYVVEGSQQKVIALEYGMRGGKAKIPVRKALLYYAFERLGLDTDPAARRSADQPIIILLNREMVLGSALGSSMIGDHQ